MPSSFCEGLYELNLSFVVTRWPPMIRGNSLPICAATVRSASCIAVRPASAEKSVNGSLRNSGSAMGLLQVLPPVPCGGLQRLSIRRMRDRRKDGWIQGNLVTVAASRASTRLGRASDHKVLDLLRSLGTWRKNERGDHSDRRAADTRACCKPTSSSSSSFSWPSPPPPLVAAFRILHPRRGHLLRQRSAMMDRGGDRDHEVHVEQGNADPSQGAHQVAGHREGHPGCLQLHVGRLRGRPEDGQAEAQSDKDIQISGRSDGRPQPLALEYLAARRTVQVRRAPVFSKGALSRCGEWVRGRTDRGG